MNKVEKKYCIIVTINIPSSRQSSAAGINDGTKNVSLYLHQICGLLSLTWHMHAKTESFVEGEVVSIALVAKLLETVGTKQLMTVDIHSSLALSHFTIDVQNVSSIPLLANYAANNMKFSNPIVASPDVGGIKRAEQFAKILKLDAIALKKARDKVLAKYLLMKN